MRKWISVTYIHKRGRLVQRTERVLTRKINKFPNTEKNEGEGEGERKT